MPDLNALADVVTMTVKAALGPVLERVAAIEARVSQAPATEKAISDLRDRVLAVETKAAMPIPDVAGPLVAATVGPIVERLTAAEARISAITALEKSAGELRDRVVTLETKSILPPVADPTVGEIRDRVLALESKGTAVPLPAPVISETGNADFRDRLVALETRTAGPFVSEAIVSELRERIVTLESRVNDAPIAKDVAALRERVAVVEVRSAVPGPPGKDGQNGRNGTDGMGFDDLSVVHDGERGFTFKATRGDRVKELGTFTIPAMIQRGVYVDGKTYEHGDVVTWAGSQWHCNEATTTKPGDGSKAWTLVVKRGRDGKDGVDAHPPTPVVSVARPA